MPGDLNSARVAHLATELAAATGEDVETAVVAALEEKLARVALPGRAAQEEEVDALFDRLMRMPVRDHRSPDAILDYDLHGLP
ncbi:MAG TPA: type II toxin-antitoxin system VapB family antitoxin [Acidobacteriaceae bacterium]|jgi:hypothetical protein|nr:type II toxin-antitoxin system VapB family antitoxin [Acidobacteriaceae bacterium]